MMTVPLPADMIEIHVTQDMILQGVVANCRQCPVALAFNAILVDGVTAHVNCFISLCYQGEAVKLLTLGGNHKYIIDLPLVAIRWMHAFDERAGDVPLVDFRFAVKREHFIPQALKAGV